jgi:hypothetical protein
MEATRYETGTVEPVGVGMTGTAEEPRFDLMGDYGLALVVKKHFSPVPGLTQGKGDIYAGGQLRNMISRAFHEAYRDNRKLYIDLDAIGGYTITFLVATFNQLFPSLAAQEEITEEKVSELVEVTSKNKGLRETVEIVKDYERRKQQLKR